MSRRAVSVVLSIVVLCGTLVYVYRTRSAPNASSFADSVTGDTLTAVTAPTATPEVPSQVVNEAVLGEDLREYRNPAYRFSLKAPQYMTVKEYRESDGALTVTFEKADSAEQFQIYVTPYSSAQITQEQFLRDEPSGVMREPVGVVVDGTTGQMFYSTNAVMGETREVWFIRNNFLYEVTTYKELDGWLAKIMTTWKFL